MNIGTYRLGWSLIGLMKPLVVKIQFGTAGIRGKTNIDITPTLALQLGAVFGDYLGNKGTVAMGRDTRYGALMLAQSAASGLMSAGVSVRDCGCIPTGLANFIRQHQLAGGFLVTGSHTPYDMSGLIILLGDGAYLSPEVGRDLENRLSAVLPAQAGLSACAAPAYRPSGAGRRATGTGQAVTHRQVRKEVF